MRWTRPDPRVARLDALVELLEGVGRILMQIDEKLERVVAILEELE